MYMQPRSRVNFSFFPALPPLTPKLSDNKLINLLLYGDPRFDSNKNIRLLNIKMKYVMD